MVKSPFKVTANEYLTADIFVRKYFEHLQDQEDVKKVKAAMKEDNGKRISLSEYRKKHNV
jgi:hypothetical protein